MTRPSSLTFASLTSNLRQTGMSRRIPIAPYNTLFSAPITSTRLPTSPPSCRSLHTTQTYFRAPVPSHPAYPASSSRTNTSIPGLGSTSLNGSSSSSSSLGTTAGSNGSGGGQAGKKKSAHLVWYREIVPAMIPILLLSTTLFLLLSLLRTHLSSERSLAISQSQIRDLESQLESLQREAKRRLDREKRERERMLPLVVERVLTRVGAMRGQEEDEEGEKEKERVDKERALLL